jgi:hypothetical protein
VISWTNRNFLRQGDHVPYLHRKALTDGAGQGSSRLNRSGDQYCASEKATSSRFFSNEGAAYSATAEATRISREDARKVFDLHRVERTFSYSQYSSRSLRQIMELCSFLIWRKYLRIIESDKEDFGKVFY